MGAKLHVCFFTVVMLLIGVISAQASTIHVKADGSGDYPTIQAAINAAVANDVIILNQGTYTGTGNKNIDFNGKAITVRSIDPNDPLVVAATVIDCENLDRGFYFHNSETTSSTVDGLTITNGNSPLEGGGIYCNAGSPTIRHCTISDCKSGGGGGGICIYGSPMITNCKIKRNCGNTSTANGGGILCRSGQTTIRNCVIGGNWTHQNAYGGGICLKANMPAKIFINNCTIGGNYGGNGAGGIHKFSGTTGQIYVTNSIVWGNVANASPEEIAGGGVSVAYSDVRGGYSGSYNINTDPLFVDDYHIAWNSPCKDNGDPGFNGAGQADIDNDARVVFGRVDMGADEVNGAILKVEPLQLSFAANQNGPNPSDKYVNISNIGTGTLYWQAVEECNWLTVVPVNGESTGEVDSVTVRVDTTGLPVGQYTTTLTINSPNTLNNPQASQITLDIYPPPVTINVEADGSGDYPTIQAAINASGFGDTIILGQGTYTGNGNWDIDFNGKSLTIISENGPNNCIIDCGDSSNHHRGFYFHNGEGPNSIVSGLTIRDSYSSYEASGYATVAGAVYCHNASPTFENCILTNNGNGYPSGYSYSYGGAVYCYDSHATFKACTFTNNSVEGISGGISGGDGGAAYGGAVYSISGCPSFIDCVFTGNLAQGGFGKSGIQLEPPTSGGYAFGGAIWADIVRLQNCLFVNNIARGGPGGSSGHYGNAPDGVGYGGAVYSESTSTTINNCTLSMNKCEIYGISVSNGGGVYGNAVLSNCILWGNLGDDLAGCTATYSCIQEATSGTGNIHVNPLFVSGPLGSYYLSQILAGQAVNSPCVDAGSDTAYNLGMHHKTTCTNEEVDSGQVDMGFHYTRTTSRADLNSDHIVNLLDYSILASQWLGLPSTPSADIAPAEGDGIVDILDLKNLCEDWLWP